ncbi:MAG: DUF4031 domain-containing protein [Streptosporangiales bacterium]|nr:DUF4031 domain-containing protein [Streptosporangiales bacterium]MBO0892224.1 DUF4031 domain-containing protein [Acidothermales bacterium]
MTVLIDAATWPRHGRMWCHLVSDASFHELHAFAASVGMPERAFHRDHYDVPAERRDDMLRAGAQAVTSRELVRRIVAAGLRRRHGVGAGR